MEHRDIEGWLTSKLDEPWSSERLAPLLTKEVLQYCLLKFTKIDNVVRMKLLFSFLSLRKKQYSDLEMTLNMLLQVADEEEDEWLKALSQLMAKIGEDKLLLDVDLEPFQNTIRKLSSQLDKTGAPKFYPLEYMYLNRNVLPSATADMLQQQVDNTTNNPHFKLKKTTAELPVFSKKTFTPTLSSSKSSVPTTATTTSTTTNLSSSQSTGQYNQSGQQQQQQQQTNQMIQSMSPYMSETSPTLRNDKIKLGSSGSAPSPLRKSSSIFIPRTHHNTSQLDLSTSLLGGSSQQQQQQQPHLSLQSQSIYSNLSQQQNNLGGLSSSNNSVEKRGGIQQQKKSKMQIIDIEQVKQIAQTNTKKKRGNEPLNDHPQQQQPPQQPVQLSPHLQISVNHIQPVQQPSQPPVIQHQPPPPPPQQPVQQPPPVIQQQHHQVQPPTIQHQPPQQPVQPPVVQQHHNHHQPPPVQHSHLHQPPLQQQLNQALQQQLQHQQQLQQQQQNQQNENHMYSNNGNNIGTTSTTSTTSTSTINTQLTPQMGEETPTKKKKQTKSVETPKEETKKEKREKEKLEKKEKKEKEKEEKEREKLEKKEKKKRDKQEKEREKLAIKEKKRKDKEDEKIEKEINKKQKIIRRPSKSKLVSGDSSESTSTTPTPLSTNLPSDDHQSTSYSSPSSSPIVKNIVNYQPQHQQQQIQGAEDLSGLSSLMNALEQNGALPLDPQHLLQRSSNTNQPMQIDTPSSSSSSSSSSTTTTIATPIFTTTNNNHLLEQFPIPQQPTLSIVNQPHPPPPPTQIPQEEINQQQPTSSNTTTTNTAPLPPQVNLEEIIQTATQLTPENQQVLERFFKVDKINPSPQDGHIKQIPLSIEQKTDDKGTDIVETVIFEIDYENQTWKMFKRKKKAQKQSNNTTTTTTIN